MSEHAQIEIRRGAEVVKIHSGWGTPSNVLPALRRAAAKGYKTPQTVANKFMELLEDASFGLWILTEDFDRDALSYFYSVDVSQTPWTVVQTKMPGYKIIVRDDGTGYPSSKLTPTRKRTIKLAQQSSTAHPAARFAKRGQRRTNMSELDMTKPDEQTNDELYEACSQAKDCFERGCVDDAVGWLQEARNIAERFARLNVPSTD